jgi:spoIIIJ-associated protein
VADQVETAARTVEEAVKLALLRLDATLDEVDIKIVDSGTPGKLLGLGAREARILVTRRASPFVGDEVEADLEPPPPAVEEPRSEAPPPAVEAPWSEPPPPAYVDEPEPMEDPEPVEAENLVEVASDLIQGLVDRMGFDATVETTSEDPLSFNVYSEDDRELEGLIGPRGENLRAFGFLLNSMLGRIARRGVRVFVDVNGYRQGRADELGELARRAAESVGETHEPVTLEAMPAHERRLVHITLAEHAGVCTYSVGQGKERQVVIGPED